MKVVQETATQNTPPAKRARWNWKKYTSNKKGALRFISRKSIHIISCVGPTYNLEIHNSRKRLMLYKIIYKYKYSAHL